MDKRIILVGAALVGVGFLMWQRSRSGSTTVVGGGGTLPSGGGIQSILKPIVIVGGGRSPVADTTVGNVAPVAPHPVDTSGFSVGGGNVGEVQNSPPPTAITPDSGWTSQAEYDEYRRRTNLGW